MYSTNDTTISNTEVGESRLVPNIAFCRPVYLRNVGWRGMDWDSMV